MKNTNSADAVSFFFFELLEHQPRFQNRMKITKNYFRIVVRKEKENFNLLMIIRGIETLLVDREKESIRRKREWGMREKDSIKEENCVSIFP